MASCCCVAGECPCDTGLSSAVATWTGSVTVGHADCLPCSGTTGFYYTLKSADTWTLSSPFATVSRLTTSPNPCAMSGSKTGLSSVFSMDYMKASDCTKDSDQDDQVQYTVQFYIDKPTTGRNYWQAKVTIAYPTSTDCASNTVFLVWRAAYQASSPCTPGAWTYRSDLSQPASVNTIYGMNAGPSQWFYKVTAFSVGSFTLT